MDDAEPYPPDDVDEFEWNSQVWRRGADGRARTCNLFALSAQLTHFTMESGDFSATDGLS
jgi:hypothetical protein